MRPTPLLAPLLVVPGLAVEGVVRLRNRLYASGVYSTRRLPRPVISIGNLTLGGAGKTPLVLHVAATLLGLGRTPAVLTRGYGRRDPDRTYILAPGQHVAESAETLGDEPALLRKRQPELWLGISADRHGAGLRIAASAADSVFILDDGFQHRRLHRDLDIVVIDRTQPLADNSVFPRGTLREPLASLGRAQILVLHGRRDPASDAIEDELRRANPTARVLHAESGIAAFVPFDAWRCGAAAGPAPTSAYLVAAIGNPARYHADVEARGVRAAGARYFRDHRRITPQEWRACAASAERAGAEVLLVTEKDAIKLGAAPGFPLMVAVQSVGVEEAAELERILATVGSPR